jgi:primosomal protein N' (replication factor Y)
MCHGCGFKTSPPHQCPSCKSPDVIYKSAGTKAVADTLLNMFPNHRIARFDGDNKGDERFEKQYKAVHDGQVDIIVGTQIVAKGLDLPKLGMVGLITAETSLYLPDYTADERTFQLIYQLLGRVGRGHSQLAAKAIIQTYQPDNEVIKSAIRRDWPSFYKSALTERKAYRFPPYSYNLKLVCRRRTTNGAHSAGQKLFDTLLNKNIKGVQLIGPMPSFHYKRAGVYYWQIIAKSKDRSSLVELTKSVPANWSIDLDPTHLL